MATMDEMIEAIRSNELVGKGSCSTIDECYDRADLEDSLRENNIDTVEAAVRWAVSLEDRVMDRMMDCRFGDDDDAEVGIHEEWEAKKAAYDGKEA